MSENFLRMVDVINAGAGAPLDHPLTRRDENDMTALINAFLCGEPIDRIGEWNDRGIKTVISDEALTGDIYHTRFTTKDVKR